MAVRRGRSAAKGWGMCVAPNCECYTTRQTDKSGKTYIVGVTNIEDLTPGSSTFS
jgi:hypothetical protein